MLLSSSARLSAVSPTLPILHIVSRPPCNICSSGCVIFICDTNEHRHEQEITFDLGLFIHDFLAMQKNAKLTIILSCPLSSICYSGCIFPYFVQITISIRQCFTCNNIPLAGGWRSKAGEIVLDIQLLWGCKVFFIRNLTEGEINFVITCLRQYNYLCYRVRGRFRHSWMRKSWCCRKPCMSCLYDTGSNYVPAMVHITASHTTGGHCWIKLYITSNAFQNVYIGHYLIISSEMIWWTE